MRWVPAIAAIAVVGTFLGLWRHSESPHHSLTLQLLVSVGSMLVVLVIGELLERRKAGRKRAAREAAAEVESPAG